MNSALTPEKRPDKNGKLVTRHVKTGGSTGLSGRGIPAPQSAVPSREKLSTDIAAILNTDPGRRGDMSREAIVRSLSKVKSAKVINDAYEALTDPERSRYISKLIDDALDREETAESKIKVYCASDGLFRRLEEYGFQMPNAMYSDFSNYFSHVFPRNFRGPATDDHVQYFKANLFARKMQMSEESYTIPFEYYREMEQIKQNFDRIESNIPVLMMAYSRKFGDMYYDDMAAICDKVESSGYPAEDIADVMRERDIQDVDQALIMMNDTAKPLYSGVL